MDLGRFFAFFLRLLVGSSGEWHDSSFGRFWRGPKNGKPQFAASQIQSKRPLPSSLLHARPQRLRKVATQSDPTTRQADIRMASREMELHKPQSQSLARAQTPTLAIPTSNTAPQRRSSSLPIPVDDTLNTEEQAAAASLRARDSDSEWRAFLFWTRMGKPPALDPRTSTSTRSDAARSGRRSPSPRSVAFDVPRLDGEDALFALEV